MENRALTFQRPKDFNLPMDKATLTQGVPISVLVALNKRLNPNKINQQSKNVH